MTFDLKYRFTQDEINTNNFQYCNNNNNNTISTKLYVFL